MNRSEDFQSVRHYWLREDTPIKWRDGCFPQSWQRGPNRGQGGHQFMLMLIEHKPKTVGEAVRLGAATVGYQGRKMTARQVRDHLWWFYTEPENCLEIDGIRWPAIPQDAILPGRNVA
jgi:hypothetical protein